ncbi:TIM-barrel domain-containing protein [Paenibacillus ginsengarvi]|uniref:Glycoside hydrolase family 31 protein n=1 Tax=Paenibacillus ginsengarvi TaxID=400777 RepID=A0A3B0C8L5_9BACL|nr:TIM-barrel domain-containing protein [Paenibacillus ginsengarvi]RKN79186.1 glycoside hydrolase family 31 protein [Paenibacillus ginsengarvi]
MSKQQWMPVAPGVWRLTVGSPQGLTPLSWIGASPRTEALERLPQNPPPFDFSEIGLDENGSRGFVLSFPLDAEEKLYGTGLQFMRMNQRGRTRYLRVNSDPKQDTGESHAPVPFYASDRGYGVLVDSAAIVTMHLGSTMKRGDARDGQVRDRNERKGWKATLVSPRAEIVLPADGADVYVFAGPTLGEAVCRYNLFCGGGALPPKWGLGFWHRVPTLYSDSEALEEALEFRKRDYPCDVVGLEPGWHSKSYPVTYEWDKTRFPDPARFVREMDEHGFRINLWEHPYVSPDSELYAELEPLSGSHTVWGGLAPDYTVPEAAALYKEQHDKRHVEIGVSGYKLDECDGSELTNNAWMFPAHAAFPSGHDGERMRQLYGLLFQKMTDDLFRSHNRRTYGLIRASNAAASPMPYVLYSDLYDHRQFIRALGNASFSGLLWTPEVRKAKSAEDWVRRMQSVCFSPLAMLNAWGDGTKPWSYSEVEPIIRHYIKLRMRLLPYLYTAFARYKEEGVPPFRAMPLVMSREEIARAEAGGTVAGEGDILNTTDAAYGKRTSREWDDQYMVGDELLVAPLFEGESERNVLLPPGIWYGFETGDRYEGGRIVRVSADLAHIPVFVRDGAIIPTIPAAPRAPRKGETTPLQFVHFGTADGVGRLYDDDGETLDCERGAKGWWTAAVSRTPNGGYDARLSGPDDAAFAYGPVSWKLAQTSLPAE